VDIHVWVCVSLCISLSTTLREALSSFSASPTSLLRRRELGGFTSVFIYTHKSHISTINICTICTSTLCTVVYVVHTHTPDILFSLWAIR
jgi:hypothetical protein